MEPLQMVKTLKKVLHTLGYLMMMGLSSYNACMWYLGPWSHILEALEDDGSCYHLTSLYLDDTTSMIWKNLLIKSPPWWCSKEDYLFIFEENDILKSAQPWKNILLRKHKQVGMISLLQVSFKSNKNKNKYKFFLGRLQTLLKNEHK